MRTLLCLILMGVLSSQNLPIGRSQQPQIKTPFEIDYLDLPIPNTFNQLYRGQVLVSFQIDENGDVVNPEIIDTFDIKLNEGDLFLFPANMLHRSPPNMTSKIKTIISFNIDFNEVI